ncbi:MAG: hypothetical protein NXI25_11470 [bacterium]|nr:hypothetical protein [bacterium]
MYKRVLYKALEDHLDRKLITVVTGMRRVGKTTAVKYLLEKAFEVKETPTPYDYQTLEKRARQLELPDCALIGRYPPQGGFTDFIWGGVVG